MAEEPRMDPSKARARSSRPRAGNPLKDPLVRGLRSLSTWLDTTADQIEDPNTSTTQTVTAPIQQVWRQTVLNAIRSLLPRSVRRSWSDQTLTGIILATLIVSIGVTVNLLPKPVEEQPRVIAVSPVPAVEEVVPVVEVPREPVLPSPKPKEFPKKPIAPLPSVAPMKPDQPTQSSSPSKSADTIQPPPPNSAQSTPTASSEVAKLVPSPQPIPPAPVTPEAAPLLLTPEQKLIASIQDQVASITNQYAEGLIQTIQANFRLSRLTVKISDGWYDLSSSQQDQLANTVFRRVKDLDFSKLQLIDATDVPIARSPVIGEEMIILRRMYTSAAPVSSNPMS